jgi:hypothetical protein
MGLLWITGIPASDKSNRPPGEVVDEIIHLADADFGRIAAIDG